jgi:hypothetical protein
MTAVSDIPISSFTWLLGSAAVLVLGVKSLQSYRRSRTELLKYAAWFAIMIGISLTFFSLPSLFTLNPAVLLKWDLAGEVLYYGSMVVQAAMVWLLILRRYMSVYAATVPVALLCLSSWIYAIPRARVVASPDFVDYLDPRFSTFVMGGLLLVLFLPVGIYFLRLAPSQHGTKSVLNSLIFGLTYIGVGLTTGLIEIITGKIINRTTAPGLIVFFVALLVIALWPRRGSGAAPPPPAEEANSPRSF